jgi:hypothetical protein
VKKVETVPEERMLQLQNRSEIWADLNRPIYDDPMLHLLNRSETSADLNRSSHDDSVDSPRCCASISEISSQMPVTPRASRHSKGSEPVAPRLAEEEFLKCEFWDEEGETRTIVFEKMPLGITFSELYGGKKHGVGQHHRNLQKGTMVVICGKVPAGGHASDLGVRTAWHIVKPGDLDIPLGMTFEQFTSKLRDALARANLPEARRNSLVDGFHFDENGNCAYLCLWSGDAHDKKGTHIASNRFTFPLTRSHIQMHDRELYSQLLKSLNA